MWLSFGPSEFLQYMTSIIPRSLLLIFYADIAQASAAANRILSLRVRDKTGGKTLPPDFSDAEGGVQIEFKKVWFKYPTRDIPIFSGLNLTVSSWTIGRLRDADMIADRERTIRCSCRRIW